MKINAEQAIKNLLVELGLTKDAELARKLKISSNALSMLKKRNSIGTIIEKVLENIEHEVSINKIIYGDDSTCFHAYYLASQNNTQEEYLNLIKSFSSAQTIMINLKYNLQRVNSRIFFEKLTAQASTDSQKLLVLIYSFLLHLEKHNLQIGTKELPLKFRLVFSQFNISKLNSSGFGIYLNNNDFNLLIDWIRAEFDFVSIIEIISLLPDIKTYIKEELVILDSKLSESIEVHFANMIVYNIY